MWFIFDLGNTVIKLAYERVLENICRNASMKRDRFVFSHRFRCAKPDPEIFRRALEVIGALPQQTVFVDDMVENVIAAGALGMKAYQYRDALSLTEELVRDDLL